MKTNLLYVPLTLLLAVVVASCGGGNSGGTPTPAAATPIPPTLSANVSALALVVSGSSRSLIFTNVGTSTAVAVTYSISPALPTGTTISPASCGDIAAAATCTLTVTPGATLSASAGAPNPTPTTLSIAGTNTNTLARTIDVLTYGSVYQSGYVFAIDDTKPVTGSIGGTVAALVDQASAFGTAIQWSSVAGGGPAFDDIAGISQASTNPPDACKGNSDGACNSQAIVAFYSPPNTTPAINRSSYAAGLCTVTIAGYADWYLPAVCELGYDAGGGGGPSGSACGSSTTPVAQNMQLNLVENGMGNLAGYYWSSTERSGTPDQHSFMQSVSPTGSNSYQAAFPKDFQYGVRCARALTF
ncbi:MAG: hypothetical protein ABI771_10650 [Betaproteobacteria bacterium]